MMKDDYLKLKGKNRWKMSVNRKFLMLFFCMGVLTPGGVQASNDVMQDSPVKQCLQPNQPVGVARGIFPGRVVESCSGSSKLG